MRKFAILLPFVLAACSDPPPPAVTQTPPAQPAPVTPAPPPPPAPMDPVTPAGPVSGSWTGFGEARFGMDDTGFRAAWKELLDGNEGGEGCYMLWPARAASQSELAFMFDEGKFARYSTDSAAQIAPGGGKVGMTRAQIDTLYAGRIEERPHKYSDGKYLRIKSDAGDNGVLVFETDAAGTVTEWRVGVEPQVDFVEGCS
jgi:hypothetical protein